MEPGFVSGMVSVIVPTRDRAALTIECLDSVHAQTYRPLEVLVVDDGSADGTRSAVAEWGRGKVCPGSFELRYRFQENRGAPAARNIGLIDSQGEF